MGKRRGKMRRGGGWDGKKKEDARKIRRQRGKSAKKMQGKTSRKAWESEEEKMRGNRGNGKEKA